MANETLCKGLNLGFIHYGDLCVIVFLSMVFSSDFLGLTRSIGGAKCDVSLIPLCTVVLSLYISHSKSGMRQIYCLILRANRAIGMITSDSRWFSYFLARSCTERVVRSVAASMSLSVTYGQHLVSKSSYAIVRHANVFTSTVATAAAPGTAPLVEMFPILNRLPEAFSSWKRKARLQQEEFSSLCQKFLDETKMKMVCSVH